MTDDVLDNPVWASLTGSHAHLAEVVGQAARYPAEISPFSAVRTDVGDEAWADLAALVGPGTEAWVAGTRRSPDGWDVVGQIPGVQLVATSLATAPDPEAVELGPADRPEVLDLVARTRPGPFERRTMELGRFLGIRRDGVLVAMAGERLHPPGWVEISAVCTDPAYRGQGLANRLIRAVGAGIRERGERPFLHAAESNENAIRLYLSMGFELRLRTTFLGVRTPTRASAAG